MFLPEFIENVDNEVLICALTLGGILFCVGLRLYNNGIRTVRSRSDAPPQSTNLNMESSENTSASSSNGNVDDYYAGELDREYMESLSDSNYRLDNENSDYMKYREDKKRELDEVRASGNIIIRLKYVNDRTRYVHAPPDIPVGIFKKKFFANELENQNKIVRLISQGRELKPNSPDNPARRCLRDYGVTDNSTIHCIIRDAPSDETTGQRNGNQVPPSTPGHFYRTNFNEGSGDIDFGSYALIPLLAIILISVWFFRLAQPEYFSLLSTVALIFLSLMFLAGAYSSFFNSNNQSTPNVGRRSSSSSSSVAAGDTIRP